MALKAKPPMTTPVSTPSSAGCTRRMPLIKEPGMAVVPSAQV